MASKTLHTNQITFMDLTDDRKLDVYIASNLPTTQIKDNNAIYTSWIGQMCIRDRSRGI